MAIGLRFDKGASEGTADQSREDFAVDEVCTIVATGVVGTATFQILAPPLGSTAALVPVDATSQSITIDVAGRWNIRVGDTADGSRTERTFAAPSLLRGLIPPAHNETASPDANAADTDPGTWVDESESNLGGRTTGHSPDLQKAVNAIELNADLALGARETGWVSGGLITVNVDPAKYDIAAGTIRVQGVIDPIAFTAKIGVTPLNVLTETFTVNGIDASGDLVQTNDQPATVAGAIFRRTHAMLQNIVHIQGLPFVDVFRQTSEHQTQESLDVSLFRGPSNSGNDYSAAANDLTAKKSAGLTALEGLAAVSDPLAPAYQVNPAQDPIVSGQIFRDGAGGHTILPDSTIPVGFWDNNTGSLLATPKFVIYQMQFFNNLSGTIVGQTTYDTEAEALAAVLTEMTDLPPSIAAIPNTYRTAIIAEGTITDLNNAVFFKVPEGN